MAEHGHDPHAAVGQHQRVAREVVPHLPASPAAGSLAESIKQVFASLWNDRAFEEREFYRVDHRQTAMGVLVHPSYKMERANGVAVTLDILYQRDGYSYVNIQVGEDMATNPQAQSIPEEVLLPWRRAPVKLMQASNRVGDDERVLSAAHLETLRQALNPIHEEFAKLYGKNASDGAAVDLRQERSGGRRQALR